MGGGESGAGAALLAKKNGYEVFVSDKGKIKEKYKDVLLHAEIQFEEGKHSESKILIADEVIKSPGIPDSIPLIKKLKDLGITPISEIEFANRFASGKKICITGSNGKTTTSLMTNHIFQKAGLNAVLAGNIGDSMAGLLVNKDPDWLILEISSFQLDGMFDFKADVAILMNITPDHLDRYEMNFQKYVDSKFMIIQNQTKEDAFIYCADDPVILKEIKKRKIKAKMYPFSISKEINGHGAWLKNDEILINTTPNTFKMTLESLALQGKHNIYNSMAAAITGSLFSIRKDNIKESLSDFQNVEHRLEYVSRIHGIEFINDSKATNVNSTWYALESINKPIIWIAGGTDKGNDYSILNEMATKKVKALICLGKDNSKLIEAFEGSIDTIVETTSMDEAIRYSIYLGEKEDVVLMSPACASFDLFENYEDRGNQFKAAVAKL